MFWTRTLGCLGIAAIAALGCESSERPSQPRYDTTPGDVREETREAWDSLKGYTYEQRQEFQTRAERALNDLDRKMDDWKARARNASADARDAWDAAIADLRVKREDVRQRFARMKEATSENWSEFKTNLGTAWEDLEDSFERASARFR